MEIQILMIVCSASLFAFLLLSEILGRLQNKEYIENATALLQTFYQRGKKKAMYARTEDWLTGKGARFHFGNWMNPYSYYGMKGVLAASGFFVGKMISMPGAILIAAFMWELPAFLVWSMNRSDNKKILPEIKLLYRSLEIQVKAGVHVTDAMAETYNVVTHKRLREALLGLAGELVMEGNMYKAFHRFERQFENEQITTLCIILLQAMQTGQAVELIHEMDGQIKDMEALARREKKQKLDRCNTFYQLGILLAMLVVVLFSCVTGMFQASLI